MGEIGTGPIEQSSVSTHIGSGSCACAHSWDRVNFSAHILWVPNALGRLAGNHQGAGEKAFDPFWHSCFIAGRFSKMAPAGTLKRWQ
jgi:hypothetical protein